MNESFSEGSAVTKLLFTAGFSGFVHIVVCTMMCRIASVNQTQYLFNISSVSFLVVAKLLCGHHLHRTRTWLEMKFLGSNDRDFQQ